MDAGKLQDRIYKKLFASLRTSSENSQHFRLRINMCLTREAPLNYSISVLLEIVWCKKSSSHPIVTVPQTCQDCGKETKHYGNLASWWCLWICTEKERPVLPHAWLTYNAFHDKMQHMESQKLQFVSKCINHTIEHFAICSGRCVSEYTVSCSRPTGSSRRMRKTVRKVSKPFLCLTRC